MKSASLAACLVLGTTLSAHAAPFDMTGQTVSAGNTVIRGFTTTDTPLGSATVGTGVEFSTAIFDIELDGDTITFTNTISTGGALQFWSTLSGGFPLIEHSYDFTGLMGGTPIDAVSFEVNGNIRDRFVGDPTPEITFTDDTLNVDFYNLSWPAQASMTITLTGAPMPSVPVPPALALSFAGLAALAGMKRLRGRRAA